MSSDAWNRYGANGRWGYDVVYPGYKYNMTDIQAALGLHQLRKLPQFHARRCAIAKRYNAAFRTRDDLQLPTERPEVQHAWHLYVLRLNSQATITRDQFIDEMRERNIGCSVHFIPVHILHYYREKYHFVPEQFPVALHAYQRMLSLPLSARMSDKDADDVIDSVTAILDEHKPVTLTRSSDVVRV